VTLVVSRGGRRVGVLDDDSGRLRFTYDADVVARRDASDAVGFRCPVRAEPWVGRDPAAVFENLLPEGGLRTLLAQLTKRDATDTVGILGLVGGDCAGALQCWPADQPSSPAPRYDPLPADGLASLWSRAAGLRSQVDGRASLSGTQSKLALWRQPPTGGPHAEYRVPRDGAASTVVIKHDDGRFAGVLEAELFGMRLMHAADVPTASSDRCAVDASCHESARFDRRMAADGTVERLHAEDGCQLTGRSSRHKYAGTGGPTYAELVAVLDRLSIDPLVDRERLLRWAVANAAMGNYDAHAKNLSVLYVQGDRIRLAPAYDVVVTAIFPSLDRTFALSFAGTTHPQALTRAGLRKVAREFRLSPATVAALVADVCDRIEGALPSVAEQVLTLGGAHSVVDALVAVVTETNEELRARLL